MTYPWRTYVCRRVLDSGQAIRVVHYDGDPEMPCLEALCGDPDHEHDSPEALAVVAWGCLLERDPSLLEVDRELHPDTWYERTSQGAPWVIEPDEEAPA